MAEKIISINKYIKEHILIGLTVCYGVVAVLAVVYMGANSVLSSRYAKREIDVSDFETVDCEYVNDMEIITQSEDSQMIFTGDIVNMYVKCEFSQLPGEFVAFYSGNENHSFGINKMEHAKVYGDWYIFRFPYGTKQVRIDPGVTISNTVTFENITINENSAKERFRYSTSMLFVSFVGAPVAMVVFYTAADILEKLKKKA